MTVRRAVTAWVSAERKESKFVAVAATEAESSSTQRYIVIWPKPDISSCNH